MDTQKKKELLFFIALLLSIGYYFYSQQKKFNVEEAMIDAYNMEIRGDYWSGAQTYKKVAEVLKNAPNDPDGRWEKRRWEALLGTAKCYEKKGEDELTVSFLKEALETKAHRDVLIWLGQVYIRTEQYREAIHAFRRAQPLNQRTWETFETNKLLSVVYGAMDSTQREYDYIWAALRISPDPGLFRRLAILNAYSMQLDASRHHFQLAKEYASAESKEFQKTLIFESTVMEAYSKTVEQIEFAKKSLEEMRREIQTNIKRMQQK